MKTRGLRPDEDNHHLYLSTSYPLHTRLLPPAPSVVPTTLPTSLPVSMSQSGDRTAGSHGVPLPPGLSCRLDPILSRHAGIPTTIPAIIPVTLLPGTIQEFYKSFGTGSPRQFCQSPREFYIVGSVLIAMCSSGVNLYQC